jgi:hypothetical protein
LDDLVHGEVLVTARMIASLELDRRQETVLGDGTIRLGRKANSSKAVFSYWIQYALCLYNVKDV